MMKTFLISAAAACAILSLGACSGKHSENTQTESTLDTTLHATEIDMTVFRAVRSYAINDTALKDSTYLAISANVQWPKFVGKYDIKPLQDSILRQCFPSDIRGDIRESMLSYVSDVKQAGFDAKSASPIFRVMQESTNSYSISTTGRFLDLGQRLLTYRVEQFSYLGGAHPNSVTSIFTYDLKRSKIITLSDLIEPDKMTLFAIGVKKQLADQTNLTIAELNQDLLVKEFPISNDVYVADGFIYVHYNPYEILPYYMGAISVEMSPYEYSSLLTPYARELLLE